LDRLREAAGRCVAALEKDEQAFASHPVFGPLGAAEWQRLHYRHYEHDLKQFNM